MKKLYIIRHAKSLLPEKGMSDFDRKLDDEGAQDAIRMGRILARQQVFPDLILSSPALRAKMTAKLIAKELGCIEKIILDRNIYEASKADLFHVVKSISELYNTVILVGHNPSLSYLGHHLVNFNEDLPTCSILDIDLDIDQWNDIEIADAELISFEYPAKHKSPDQLK